jgi:hypothetical protein
VEHDYLSADVGARIVDDARTINQALGYEMNTIEFAIKDDVPYAIDFLNPAPDFERDRITEFYFEHVVEQMAHLVIDRALTGNVANTWPRWEEMLGFGTAAGFVGSPKRGTARQAIANPQTVAGHPGVTGQSTVTGQSSAIGQSAAAAQSSAASSAGPAGAKQK